ncbi:hypothetical protein [Methylomonas sp. MgM2]
MPMTHWLYPANIKYYDVLGAMAEQQAWWPMHTKVKAGDAVLIYLAAPYKQIAFLCDVIAVGIDGVAVAPQVRRFLKGETEPGKAVKSFMALRPALSIPIDTESPLGLAELRRYGLTGRLMGSRNLDNVPSLLGYIMCKIEERQ